MSLHAAPGRVLAAAALSLGLVAGLAACGEQTPGGTKVEAGQQSAQQGGGEAATGQGESDPKALDPIVVKIENTEYKSVMAIYHKFDQVKGKELNLQQPKGDVKDVEGGGKMQEFVTGNVYWSKDTGAHIVRGQLLKTYLDNGGPTGKLGYPTGDETKDGGATYSDFQHGRIQLKDMAIQVIEKK